MLEVVELFGGSKCPAYKDYLFSRGVMALKCAKFGVSLSALAALAAADPSGQSGQSSALSCDAMARLTPLVLSGVALDAPACSQPQACADPQAPTS